MVLVTVTMTGGTGYSDILLLVTVTVVFSRAVSHHWHDEHKSALH